MCVFACLRVCVCVCVYVSVRVRVCVRVHVCVRRLEFGGPEKRHKLDVYVKRDLWKRPIKDTCKRDLHGNDSFILYVERDQKKKMIKETHKRDLLKRPTKQTIRRNPQKRL